ncbi:Mrp family chromosome partitioning ATPase [Geothermobacter ehrlichii]|uniref:Iron-sulfur cluster carrier protein n=1 Tax=Geothermobacter ehrlichii TaxID=213224 RepID=A0A5D3WIP7_9BACT|nr:Mrp/NBP35 family ATP-binding protein [Geothermobacter ehrlichii]TYO98112.1 Mrp family chromosome partitioning ATPase [Geothermobacter ehrlichii]
MTDHSDCNSCGVSSCSARNRQQGESDEQFQMRQRLNRNLCRIEHKILVMSGKGGVGKSTTALNLALALAAEDKAVGLLDVDLHGPSLPTMLGMSDQRPQMGEEGILPLDFQGLRVMSIGFLLESRDQAMIMRGPMKHGAIQQFLADVAWGPLDVLVIDCPPGTGDEPLSAAQLLGEGAGAVIVTTPQDVALVDVEKSVSFARQLKMNIIGVIENMAGFVCPHCNEVTDLFGRGGGERLAGRMDIPFLGRIPLDPRLVQSGDSGRPFLLEHADSIAAEALRHVARSALKRLTEAA